MINLKGARTKFPCWRERPARERKDMLTKRVKTKKAPDFSEAFFNIFYK
jgi:hypothetical protein